MILTCDCTFLGVGSGRCFWEKTSNGCQNGDDSGDNILEYHPYNFYALCRDGFNEHAEYQCITPPAKLEAGTCRKNPAVRNNNKITDKKYCSDCKDSTCVSRNLHSLQTFCVKCACHLHVLAEGYVLLTENAECSGKDVELAPQCVLGPGRW